MKQNDVVKELRLTLQGIADQDLQADTVRAMTRRLATLGQPTLAEESIRQLTNYGDLAGHIGLELLRVDREKYRASAEDMLKKTGASETPGPQALRKSAAVRLITRLLNETRNLQARAARKSGAMADIVRLVLK